MERKLILDLCGGTGSWSKPYIEHGGYDVRIVDLLTTGEDVRLLHIPKRPVYGVIAAPPCTEFAQSGAGHWANKGNEVLLASLGVVDSCLRVITITKPTWWVLENPEGRLRRFLGPPAYIFSPHEFGVPFSKKTLLWGEFSHPAKGPLVEPCGKWGHTDPPRGDRRLKRSMTFSAFAQAFFLANP